MTYKEALESAAKRLPPTYEGYFGSHGTIPWEDMPEYAKEAARACVLETLSAFEQAGYVLVPTEPDEKLRTKMADAVLECPVTLDRFSIAEWKAILAALKERQT